MRFFKKTIFWVIILLVLSGLFYFFDEKVTEKEVAEEAKRNLFSFVPSDVTEFSITRGGTVIAVKKGISGWVIEKPVIAYADQTAVEDLLNRAVKAKIDGVLFDEAPVGKLKELGLEPPYISVSLTTPSGTISLSLGDRGPTQNVSFAVLSNDKRVFRVHADVRSEIEKTLYDLRDKVVVAIDPRTLKQVEVLWQDRNGITIQHPQENVWDTHGIATGKTDDTKLLAFLYGVKEAKAKAFIDENPQDLMPYGLTRPRLKIKFIDNKNLLQTLLVGDKDKKLRGFYAKRGGDRNVFLLEEDFLDNVPDEAGDLEAK
ncbi:MAG: DUF4340 domain-containing protein [Candidatus Desantisbacteria bacterium]